MRNPRHINRHQDDDKSKIRDRWACMNIDYYCQVKIFLEDIKGGYRRQTCSKKKGMWQVRLCRLALSTNTRKHFKMSLHGVLLFDYWVNTNKDKSEQVGRIEWEGTVRV